MVTRVSLPCNRGTIIPDILEADEAFRRTSPNLSECCAVLSLGLEKSLQKATLPSVNPADSGWWEHAVTHGIHEHETLSSLFCCELSSLLKSNTRHYGRGQNILQSIDGNFSTALNAGKKTYIQNKNLY